MIQLSKFRKIKSKDELKPTDFLVIINTADVTTDSIVAFGNRNRITYNGHDYYISVLKGLFGNLLERSKAMMNDKSVREKYASDGYKFLSGGVADDGMIEVYAHKTLQAFIDDNAVFAYHKRVEGEIDMNGVIDYIISKGSFHSASVN